MGKYRYSYSYSYSTFPLGKQNQTLVLLSKICDIHSISDKCHKCIGSIKYIKCSLGSETYGTGDIKHNHEVD